MQVVLCIDGTVYMLYMWYWCTWRIMCILYMLCCVHVVLCMYIVKLWYRDMCIRYVVLCVHIFIVLCCTLDVGVCVVGHRL